MTPPATDSRWIERVPLDEIPDDDRNPKDHVLDEISASMDRFGFTEPVLLDERTGLLVAGHGRKASLLARREAGRDAPDGVEVRDGTWMVPVTRGWSSADDDEAAAYLVASNRLSEAGGWSRDPLEAILSTLGDSDLGLAGIGFSNDDLDALSNLGGGFSPFDRPDVFGGGGLPEPDPDPDYSGPEATQTLAERFLVPPFSVLDARQGYWKNRRAAWLALGIRSEEGRAEGEVPEGRLAIPGHRSMSSSPTGADPAFYEKKRTAERRLGRELSTAEFLRDHYDGDTASVPSTSVFDPVLSEVAYRWFSGPGSEVLDPFAGGSVRGLVASALGRRYTGIDIRETQVTANEAQADLVLAGLPSLGDPPVPVERPTWIIGDALAVDSLLPADARFDLLFSCPPYFDLEVYSDDPGDLSAQDSYEDFLDAYRRIIASSAAPRAARSFVVNRRPIRVHQTVLVFCKGDPRLAAEAAGPVTVDDLPVAEGEAPDVEETP